MNYWTQSTKNIYVAAHMGGAADHPENTMEAFRASLKFDIDQIETDLHMTKDGELILMHDDTVDRTTNGSGLIREMTLSEIKTLDAGNGNEVPTFVELMELVKDHPALTLDVELKDYPIEGRDEFAYEACDKALKIIDDYGFTDRVVINSWDVKLHEYIYGKYGNKYRLHMYYPKRHLEWYNPSTSDPYVYGYCTCIFGFLEGEITRSDTEKLQKETGIRLWAGTYANNEKTIDASIEMGVELITCDNPDEVIEILRKKNLHR